MRVMSCKASATRLKFHTDAVAPKHIAIWNHSVSPWRVEEGGVVGRLSYRPLPVGIQQVVSKDLDVGVLRRTSVWPWSRSPTLWCRDVPSLDCGVVGGPSPVLPTAFLPVKASMPSPAASTYWPARWSTPARRLEALDGVQLKSSEGAA